MQMLGKIAALIASFVGVSSSNPQKTELLDSDSILFSVPTLSDEIAETEPATSHPLKEALVFHEDDWCQVEFLRDSQVGEIQKILREYKPFEAKNRTTHGWKNVYVRQFKKHAVVGGKQGVAQIASLLHSQKGDKLYLSSAQGIGYVKNGFTIPIGGNISLYGTINQSGIAVLAADVGQNPDNTRLTEAFNLLNKKYGLVLVDWKSQMILLSQNKSGKIDVWKP